MRIFTNKIEQDIRLFPILWRIAKEEGRKYIKTYIAILILSALYGGSIAIIAYIAENFADGIFTNRNKLKFYFIVIIIILFMNFIVRELAKFGQTVLLARISHKIIYNLEVKWLKYILNIEFTR